MTNFNVLFVKNLANFFAGNAMGKKFKIIEKKTATEKNGKV